jgi:hypothetical protein
MKAITLRTITHLCKSDPDYLKIMMILVDTERRNAKTEALNARIREIEQALDVDDEPENDNWCCNEPPDDYGFCPSCKEHII